MKRYLVLDTGLIVDSQMFGFDTAGSDDQHNLIIRGQNVYEEFWSPGNEWIEDSVVTNFLGTIAYESDIKLEIIDQENYGETIEWENR